MQLWLFAAFASALFAGAVSILAKCGLKTIDSDVATALRTCIVAVFTWVMVAIVGSAGAIAAIVPRSWLFLALSGLATGASWICYFKALSLGDVNKVVPIDKSSTLMAVIVSIALFGETSNLVLRLTGTLVATVGTLMMVERKAAAGPAAATAPPRRDASLAYALLAAVFAALTSVLAKVGIEGVESNLATAIRTMFVLSWRGASSSGGARPPWCGKLTEGISPSLSPPVLRPVPRGCATTTPFRWGRLAWSCRWTSYRFLRPSRSRAPSLGRGCRAGGLSASRSSCWEPRLL